MNIEKRGVRITGIAAVTVIDAVPGEGITIGGISPDARYSTAEITELRDALNAALEAMGEPVTSGADGPWVHLDQVPANVNRLRDVEGDLLRRNDDGKWNTSCRSYDHWSSDYGPFERA